MWPLGDELHADQSPRRDHLGHGPQAAAAQLPGQRRTWEAGGAAWASAPGPPRSPPRPRPAGSPRPDPPRTAACPRLGVPGGPAGAYPGRERRPGGGRSRDLCSWLVLAAEVLRELSMRSCCPPLLLSRAGSRRGIPRAQCSRGGVPCCSPSLLRAKWGGRAGPEGKPLCPLSTYRCGVLKERGRERRGIAPCPERLPAQLFFQEQGKHGTAQPPGFLKLYGEPRANPPRAWEGTEALLWGISVCLGLLSVQDAELKRVWALKLALVANPMQPLTLTQWELLPWAPLYSPAFWKLLICFSCYLETLKLPYLYSTSTSLLFHLSAQIGP